MNYIASISSKRQLTIPSAVYKKMGLNRGDKLLIIEEGTVIKISKFDSILDNLAGSVRIPDRFKGKTTEDMIEIAKKEHIDPS